MKRLILAAGVAAALSGCAAVTAVKTGQPLNPAQVQQDLANAVYLMQAAGCTLGSAAAAAAPIVQVAGDEQGNQVLTAVGASGAVACKLTVPPSALPVPAPANAPAAAAPAPSTAPAKS